MLEKICKVCNNKFKCFDYVSDKRHTCSKSCKSIYIKSKTTKYNCLICNDQSSSNFYGARKNLCKKCFNISLMVKRQKLLIKARNLLGGKCSNCGYNKCSAALEFHHISDNKEFTIAGAKYSWNKLEKEIKKCILLCSNCHRELHNPDHILKV